jgi:hypothetical protein
MNRGAAVANVKEIEYEAVMQELFNSHGEMP